MGRIQVGEQEADRYRLDTGSLEFFCGLTYFIFVERRDDVADRRRDAFADRLTISPKDEWTFLPGDFLLQRVVLGALMATDVDDVAEAPRSNHAGLGTAVL